MKTQKIQKAWGHWAVALDKFFQEESPKLYSFMKSLEETEETLALWIEYREMTAMEIQLALKAGGMDYFQAKEEAWKTILMVLPKSREEILEIQADMKVFKDGMEKEAGGMS